VWMCCLPSDLEDLAFLDSEIPRTCENDQPVQSGVVGVSDAEDSETAGVCVAVIGNGNVTRTNTKAWAISGITPDCPLLSGHDR
jgi:hypothetical protein